MPTIVLRQEVGPESKESLWGDAVPVDGTEDQATRRTHMREQTMARQAAERRRILPPFEARLDRSARLDAAREREADLQVELLRINAGHQTWLRDRSLPTPVDIEPRSLFAEDPLEPE
ncbi:MAG TPA: hypothetical protein VNL35_04780 [Chloroflexota bacterium]|nr:hypothetical protein [Chloroflexota bacterium]